VSGGTVRTGRTGPAGHGLLLLGIILVAINLRPAISSFGPLVGEIRSDTGASAAAIGVLGTLPVLCFGAFSAAAPRLARRFGMEEVLCLALIVLSAGIMVRVVPGIGVFFAGTVLIGMAIAICNVLLPVQIKRSFSAQTKRISNMYVVVLSLAASLAAAVAVPLADAGLGWRWSLAIWALPAAAAALVWIRLARSGPASRPETPPTIGVRSLVRSRLAVAVTLFMGLQAFGFYIILTWLPEILVNFGQGQSVAAFIFAGANLVGAIPIILLSVYGNRIHDDRPVVYAACSSTVAGAVVLILAGSGLAGAIIGSCLVGAGQGTAFALALSFFASRSADTHVAAEMSGTGQSVGYLIAAASPFLAGIVHDATGGWKTVLVGLAVVVVLQAAVGAVAGRPATIDRADFGE
jgi:CP family cyanate transporter-like MFS transporter